MASILRPIPGTIALIIILLLVKNTTYCQVVLPSGKDKFTIFEGEWKFKDDIWKTKFDGNYKEDVNPNRSFIVKAVSPKNALLWNSNFGGDAWAVLFWTYHQETGHVNHISNTTDNNVGVGVGEFNSNNDLIIKIVYPNGCKNCHRIYTFHWITLNEFEFKATIYKDDKLTDNFYGGTFLRKIQ